MLFIIILAVAVLALFLALAPDSAEAASGGPDAFGYVYEDSAEGVPHAWVEIVGTGTNTNTVGDDVYATVPIGFDFDFYGVTHNTIYASSNGYLTFGGSRTDYSNDNIPSTTDPDTTLPRSGTIWTWARFQAAAARYGTN